MNRDKTHDILQWYTTTGTRVRTHLSGTTSRYLSPTSDSLSPLYKFVVFVLTRGSILLVSLGTLDLSELTTETVPDRPVAVSCRYTANRVSGVKRKGLNVYGNRVRTLYDPTEGD